MLKCVKVDEIIEQTNATNLLKFSLGHLRSKNMTYRVGWKFRCITLLAVYILYNPFSEPIPSLLSQGYLTHVSQQNYLDSNLCPRFRHIQRIDKC